MSMSLVPGFGASTDPDMAVMARAAHGQGTIIFFGDVNAEEETFKILACLVAKK
jgi:hypothetical protein